MIDDDMPRVRRAEAVFFLLTRRESLAKSQVANDDVGGTGDRDLIVSCGHALTRSRLAGNRDVAADVKNGLQFDVAADIKHDHPLTFADRVAKRAVTGVVQVDHVIHIAAASAGGEPAEPFSRWKGELSGHG